MTLVARCSKLLLLSGALATTRGAQLTPASCVLSRRAVVLGNAADSCRVLLVPIAKHAALHTRSGHRTLTSMAKGRKGPPVKGRERSAREEESDDSDEEERPQSKPAERRVAAQPSTAGMMPPSDSSEESGSDDDAPRAQAKPQAKRGLRAMCTLSRVRARCTAAGNAKCAAVRNGAAPSTASSSLGRRRTAAAVLRREPQASARASGAPPVPGTAQQDGHA